VGSDLPRATLSAEFRLTLIIIRLHPGRVRRDRPRQPRAKSRASIAQSRREGAGPDENFFDLGGHSLLTVQVQGRLKRQLNRQVALTDLFRFLTVRRLAQFLAIDAGENGETQAAAPDSQTDARS
jgi:acyl carrier protein